MQGGIVTVSVYYIRWKNSDIRAIMSYAQKLTLLRQKKVMRYRQEADRARCVLGELLLRFARKRASQGFCEPTLDEYGKPHLPDAYFSLSHSGNVVVLAYGDKEVGVDVEQRQDHIEECMHVLSVGEQMAICTAPEELKQERFIQLWTLKESYLKMLGTGFLVDPSSISIEIHDNYFVIPAQEGGDTVYLSSIVLHEAYYLGLCAKEPEMQIEMIALSELENSLKD